MNRRRFWTSFRGEVYWASGQSLLRITEPTMFLPMDLDSHAFIVRGLTHYPSQFEQTGGNNFIHQLAYHRFQPAALNMARDICRLRADRSLSLDYDDLAESARLVRSLLSTAASTVSFIDTLAFVQSLCLLQIMALFFPDSTKEERTQGLSRQTLLIEWTQRLWESAPSELPSTFSKYEAYVFAEAVRRTILTSHKIQGCYRVAKTGFFKHTLFVETLPYGGNTSLWDSGQPVDMRETKYPSLVSYRELCDVFEAGGVETASPFEMMLLVGCKGTEAVEQKLGALTL